jgi:hypothetical protein
MCPDVGLRFWLVGNKTPTTHFPREIWKAISSLADCLSILTELSAQNGDISAAIQSFICWLPCRSGHELCAFFRYLEKVGDPSICCESVLRLEGAQRVLFNFLHLNHVRIQRIQFNDWPLSDREFWARVESHID